jgi:hypothetical protein
MTDLNHVFLIGRLTRDLGSNEKDFGYVGNGQARANVSIAVNRSRKNGEQWIDEANFFDVTIWGKTAENLKPYLQNAQHPVHHLSFVLSAASFCTMHTGVWSDAVLEKRNPVAHDVRCIVTARTCVSVSGR